MGIFLSSKLILKIIKLINRSNSIMNFLIGQMNFKSSFSPQISSCDWVLFWILNYFLKLINLFRSFFIYLFLFEVYLSCEMGRFLISKLFLKINKFVNKFNTLSFSLFGVYMSSERIGKSMVLHRKETI